MRKFIATMILIFGCGPLVFASATHDDELTYADVERVDKISLLSGIYTWNNVDDDTIIVWSTPFRPFLVDLTRKSRGLRFANTISLTSTAGQIRQKFDSVIVDGIRYPIRGIYKLDRASAKNIRKNP
jgi:hypothetical protein